MAILEVVCAGDRRSLVKRFMSKSKGQAVSDLVDIHLAHCTRIERLEELLSEILDEVPHRWGASFSDSDIADRIRAELPKDEE